MQERIHTRDLERMGGLWSTVPRMGAAMCFSRLASLGLPGLGNFVGEFLVLLGAYRVSVPVTVVASLGFITSCVYSLWIVQRTFHGPNQEGWKPPDLSIREASVMAVLTVLIVSLGLFPQPIFTFVNPSLARLERIAAGGRQAMQIDGPTTAALPAQAFEAAFSQHGEYP